MVEDAAIAPFSFAKYLMWKDLVDRVGQLEHNRVVRHLIHEQDKAFVADGVGSMPQPREIDTRYTPKELIHPLPADSSQLAAIMAASEGHDFVIVGPPGTGKSQTIANLIAQCLIVCASFLPEQVRSERSSARGVQDLKAFLEFANRGAEAMVTRTDGSLGDPESPLEEAVIAALEERGWQIDAQVGVSKFRIDIGVVHPDKPGAYLAGVECDGATYHRSATARDRDKTRQQVLENLGWTITRVWSTDWWYDPESAIKQLDEFLNKRLTQVREEELAKESDINRHEYTDSMQTEDTQATEEAANETALSHEVNLPEASPLSQKLEEEIAHPRLVAKQIPKEEQLQYVRAELPDAKANQERFYDDDYSDALRAMATTVLQVQGPIRDDALAREVARAHGFVCAVNKIKQRVLDVLSGVTVTEESTGRFLWADNSPKELVPFRYPASDRERRSLDEIAMPELIGLVQEHPHLTTSNDPAFALASKIGLSRLASKARERLEEALDTYGEGA